MSSVFDYVNAINFTKQDLFCDQDNKGYVKFIVNRAMSYYPDTILFANQANMKLNNVSDRAHFDFYRYVVNKRKRYAKWGKANKSEDVELIMKMYNYSYSKAQQVVDLFSDQQLSELRSKFNYGGLERKK